LTLAAACLALASAETSVALPLMMASLLFMEYSLQQIYQKSHS
jgi:hypothetical protein